MDSASEVAGQNEVLSTPDAGKMAQHEGEGSCSPSPAAGKAEKDGDCIVIDSSGSDANKNETTSGKKKVAEAKPKRKRGTAFATAKCTSSDTKKTEDGPVRQLGLDAFLISASKKLKTDESEVSVEKHSEIAMKIDLSGEQASSETPAAASQVPPESANGDVVMQDVTEQPPKLSEAAHGQTEAEKEKTEPVTDSSMANSAQVDLTHGIPEAAAKAKPGPKATKTPTSANKKSKTSMNAEDKDKKLKLLSDELALLFGMRVHSDAIPFLRPSVEEICEHEFLSEEADQLSMKTRQMIARVLEGSNKTASELAKYLIDPKASEAADGEESMLDQSVCERVEGMICLVGEMVDGFSSATNDVMNSEIVFAKTWSVKDMADIAAEFRGIVDAHRKLGAATKERILHVRSIIDDIEKTDAKDIVKLDKALVVMKDKYLKLEEKEKKEKEKLEQKFEAIRMKHLERDEKLRKKEENKKKEEEKRFKEASKVDPEKDAKKIEKKQKQEAVGTEKAKQANFMASFFKKDSAAIAKPQVKPQVELGPEASTAGVSVGNESSTVASQSASPTPKAHRNFHPWEKPANAVVAGFPYGPGEHSAQAESAPEASLESWVAKWKKQRWATPRPMLPLREDGTPQRRMKLIQLHMRLPVVRTQLVDVDLDATKKVLWDVEDDSEEQLEAILNEAKQGEDGLYLWRGKTLQFATEGGGYFDSRRPPFWGIVNKNSSHITGTNPLAQDPEVDYSYESDVDWESEVGDAEELGSDLDQEEEEEEDEDDGGFVVPDDNNEMVLGADNRPKKLTKLHQVLYDARTMPSELVEMFGVRVVSEFPLVLSNDPNMEFLDNCDFAGEDISSIRAKDLETVLQNLHKHPTACSFTYILPETDSRFAGYAFFKTGKATMHKTECPGMISGYLKEVPQSKLQAIAEAEEAALAGVDVQAHIDAVMDVQQPAAAPEKPKPALEDTLSKKQLFALVKVVHGSSKTKPVVQEEVATALEISKTNSGALISKVSAKKDGRWRLNETFLMTKFLQEKATAAWTAKVEPTQKAQAPAPAPTPEAVVPSSAEKKASAKITSPAKPTGVQLTLSFTPQAKQPTLDQFGCQLISSEKA